MITIKCTKNTNKFMPKNILQIHSLSLSRSFFFQKIYSVCIICLMYCISKSSHCLCSTLNYVEIDRHAKAFKDMFCYCSNENTGNFCKIILQKNLHLE